MSNYCRFTKHPETGRWESAYYMDDYYGQHHYGVKFPDGSVYDPWVVALHQNISDREATILNRELDNEQK